MISKKFIAVALLTSFIASNTYAYRVPMGTENNNTTQSNTVTQSVTISNDSNSNAKSDNSVAEKQNSDLPYYYPKGKNGHYVFTPEELWDNNPNKPPGPVLDFLTKPTKETGELYLDWLNQRSEALAKSFMVLQELKDQEFAKHIQALKPITNSELLIVYVSVNQASANELLELQKIKAIFPNLQIMVYPIGDDPNAVVRMLYQYGFQNYVTQNNVVLNLAKIVSVTPSVYLFNRQTGNLLKAFAGGANAKEIIQAM
ncbi:hypothetical protein [Desulfurella amilsii]|jgi:hypothetical protein|nr:hypothetical protein [Desulfurella amilsii]